MSKCCGQSNDAPAPGDPLAWFRNMIPNGLAYARQAKERGQPIVGMMCEFTPRELILAVGAVPVCLCGGSVETIPAAEQDLPANLCPLIKSTYGYHALRSNPFLEMADLVVAETTCDGKKKMYELMAETRPMYVLELPQKPESAEGLAFWEAELRKFKSELEGQFKAVITDDRLREAIVLMNRERQLRRELAGLMKCELPPITGRQLLDFKSSISGLSADLEQYERAIRRLREQPACSSLASRVRVLMTGVPMAHGAERVLEIIESHGGLVVCMENCTGLKPIMEDVDVNDGDAIHALAVKYFHLPCSVMTRNDARADLIRQLVREYRPEGMVDLIWQACITYDVESRRIRQLAEQELGLPYLRIETDYSPSDSARIATRVEALFEKVRGPMRVRG